jgi:hypothetical protein
MSEHTEDSTTSALIRLASAQDRLVEDVAKILKQMTLMNGSIKDHNTQLALGSQWIENHMSDDGVHAMLKQEIESIKKMATRALAVQIILALGVAIAGIVVLLV